MAQKITEIAIFNVPIDSSNYGSYYEEYVYGYGLEYGRDVLLSAFVQTLLDRFPVTFFDINGASLLDDIGYRMVLLELSELGKMQLDLSIVVDLALKEGFYVIDETNGGLYTPDN